jgi:transposase InsO family protein
VPFRKSDVSEERLRFALAASRKEKPLSHLAAEFGISRQTAYMWLQRYQAEGAAGILVERSRSPHSRPQESVPDLVRAVIQLRRQFPDWGARKLHHVLREQRPDLGISVSTTHRILDRQGLIRDIDRHVPALKRFERERPNELWQMDFKGPKGFRHRRGPLSLMDDHSRYVLALEHLENARVKAVQERLRAVFEEHGLPWQMLIDHGTPWWNANSPWGWTELTVWLMKLGIRVLLSGIRHPQTQGKIERMHGCLCSAIWKRRADADDQLWLDQFRHEYNHVRPHQALNMATPASRWKPSPRLFPAQLSDWEYPSSFLPMQLNDSGQMQWHGRQWDISRALQNELVGIQVNGEIALVYFCNTPVRELRLQTGQSVPLPMDPFRTLTCS